MTPYRIEYHAKGSAEIVGLPNDAFESLSQQLVEVLRDPWGETEPVDKGDPPPQAFRYAPFGGGRGLVHVFLDEDRRVVRVHGIVWSG